MMYLVQLLLPIYDNDDQRLADELFHAVARELSEAFGGLTAYNRVPALGLWKGDTHATRTVRDELIVYEVMADQLDTDWWSQYRRDLGARFRQEKLIIRAQAITLL